MGWIDITHGVLPKPKAGTPPYYVGQPLVFDYEGSPYHLKIMRIHKGKIWAKEIKLYTVDEARKKLNERN